MLKIKDSVSLTELNNFGLRKSNKSDEYANPGCSNCYVINDGVLALTVDIRDRRVGIDLHNEDYLYDDLKEINLTEILYDLIKADLVEKIEEKR